MNRCQCCDSTDELPDALVRPIRKKWGEYLCFECREAIQETRETFTDALENLPTLEEFLSDPLATIDQTGAMSDTDLWEF